LNVSIFPPYPGWGMGFSRSLKHAPYSSTKTYCFWRGFWLQAVYKFRSDAPEAYIATYAYLTLYIKGLKSTHVTANASKLCWTRPCCLFLVEGTNSFLCANLGLARPIHLYALCMTVYLVMFLQNIPHMFLIYTGLFSLRFGQKFKFANFHTHLTNLKSAARSSVKVWQTFKSSSNFTACVCQKCKG